MSFLLRALLLLVCLLPRAGAAAEDFLPPEEAFRIEARALDERSIEIAFEVTEGYYLYRESFRFAAVDAKVALGAAQIPPGTIKFDETFQKDVETYRNRLVIRLPVEAAPPNFALRVVSQGCADAGLCYPPMESHVQVRLAGFGGDGVVRVVATPAPGAPPPAVGVKSGEARIDAALRDGRFWSIVGVFFGAGLLLAFTPCVLPMLPILASMIVGHPGTGSARARGLALAGAYSLGMALVYTAFGVAAGLAGEGLAAALQNPWVLGSFALVLGALALSMFGLYELQLPSAWRDRLASTSNRLQGGRFAGVFAMGGLSALIVSPCVAAPLAGALLYISQTRDVALGGSALFALSVGMSVPLLLVGASAGALLPRVGAWMESVKRLFGVLLLGVAWWMLTPLLPAALGVAGWGALLLAAASLLGAFDRPVSQAGTGRRLGQAAGLVLAVLGAVQLVGASAGAADPLRPLQPFARSGAGSGHAEGVQFRRVASVAELDAALRSAGRPVMLDFYADWCVSCKEMERFTFTDPDVRTRLGKLLLLQADVTRNTADDRALLKRFQLFGPPGIVFFDAAGREIDAVRVIGFQNAERFGLSLAAAGL